LKASKRDYRKSKAETTLRFTPGDEARELARQFLNIPCEDHRTRTDVAIRLCTALSRDAGISAPLKAEFVDKPEPHSRDGSRLRRKVQGSYRATQSIGLRRRVEATIKIYNLTAVRQQPRAPLGALTTLLHEWLHHYDTERLRIATIHTSGFYSRLKELREGLGV